MDSACYASSDNLVVGIRGGRVYKCNPTTGEVLGSSDFSQVAFGSSSIVYDVGVNRCFAAAWNTNSHDLVNFRSSRNLYRIVPSAIGNGVPIPGPADSVTDIQTLFTGFGMPGFICGSESGIANMRTSGGQVYGVGWSGNVNVVLSVFKFQANSLVTNAFNGFSTDLNPQLCYANIGGNDRVYVLDTTTSSVLYWDFTASAFNSSAADNTKGYNSIDYAINVGKLYVAREFQFIDVYTTGVDGGGNSPVYSATINTGRSTFNGVNVRYNPVDGFIYVAGGADNTVIVINPASNSIVPPNPRTGYDLPVDFVFTPTAKFAVQLGAVPLRAVA